MKLFEINDYFGYFKIEFNGCFIMGGFEKISKKMENLYFVLFKYGKIYKVCFEMCLVI